ncbi:unnamed protein product [Amoebophrya sp. A120]|nr:unnamed protein product [Amoebophrya sp. A120]|eukprot:GSA120T00018760001.1
MSYKHPNDGSYGASSSVSRAARSRSLDSNNMENSSMLVDYTDDLTPHGGNASKTESNGGAPANSSFFSKTGQLETNKIINITTSSFNNTTLSGGDPNASFPENPPVNVNNSAALVHNVRKKIFSSWKGQAFVVFCLFLIVVCVYKTMYRVGGPHKPPHVMKTTPTETTSLSPAEAEPLSTPEPPHALKKKQTTQVAMQPEAPEIGAPPVPEKSPVVPGVKEITETKETTEKPKTQEAPPPAPAVNLPPGTPISAWPKAGKRFSQTPEEKANLPLNEADDALRFTCEGETVQGIKDGEDYWVYMLPFEDSVEGRRAWDECYDMFWAKHYEESPLVWGHFEKVYDVTTWSHADPDEFPHAHHWRPALRDGVQEKEKFKKHLEAKFFGSAVTLYSFMVHAATRTSVWTGVWQHPYGVSEPKDLLKSGYFWEVQVAKESRGHGACASAISRFFDLSQRMYNTKGKSNSKYLPRLWPGVFAQATPTGLHPTDGSNLYGEDADIQAGDFDFFLKKIMIADASWESITFDYSSKKSRATKGELEKFRWFKHGARAQFPGVLMATLKRKSEQATAANEGPGVYLVDNYEPVDAFFRKSYYSAPVPVPNHPQPVDAHFGNTYGCKCYRSPWNEAEKTGIKFQEPAIVLSGWGPQNVYFDGRVEETVQDWRYTYMYDVAKYGEVLQNERIPAIPESEWIQDDLSVVPKMQGRAEKILAKERGERPETDEVAGDGFKSSHSSGEHSEQSSQLQLRAGGSSGSGSSPAAASTTSGMSSALLQQAEQEPPKSEHRGQSYGGSLGSFCVGGDDCAGDPDAPINCEHFNEDEFECSDRDDCAWNAQRKACLPAGDQNMAQKSDGAEAAGGAGAEMRFGVGVHAPGVATLGGSVAAKLPSAAVAGSSALETKNEARNAHVREVGAERRPGNMRGSGTER